MDTTDTPGRAVQAPQETDHLDQIAPVQPEAEDEDFSDDPEVIFRREYSKLDTIPLQQPVPMRVYVLFLLIFASFIGGAILGLVTYPTVTVTVVPVSRDVTLTAQLDVPTRQLAPVTMLQTQSALTTGHGHQNARAATGTLTFYNGQAAPQTIPIGTVFTGRDGVQVSTRADLTLPAANPPYLGQATVQASAIRAGSAGNIQAEDVNGTVSPALFVKNLVPFTGGSDARDFQAVAQTDLDSLTTTLKNALVQHIPQAYPLRPGETVTPTYCHSSIIADHGVGEEAMTITIKARYTCKGIAYSQDELQQRATAAFTTQTNPGANYELVSTTQPQVISLSPFTVRVSGTWVCVLVPGL